MRTMCYDVIIVKFGRILKSQQEHAVLIIIKEQLYLQMDCLLYFVPHDHGQEIYELHQ